MFYSAKTGGFYSLEIHGAAIPEDAIEITVDYHATLMQGQSIGKRIVSDVNGYPILSDPTKPGLEQFLERLKTERDRRQLEGGVKVGDHWYLSTERATGEYNSLINASQGMPEDTVLRSGWRTMSGATVDMTPLLARQILLAGIQQRCAIDDAALAHKAAMEACADPASYDFSTGWPPVFGDLQ